MKKVQRLSIFSKMLASLLGLFSVSRASAESLFKKFRWSAPKTNSQTHNGPSEDGPFHFAENPIRNPFSAKSVSKLNFSSKDFNSYGEHVTRKSQKVEGAVVRGSWVQSITNLKGEKIFESGEVIDAVPTDLREKVKALYHRKNEALEAFTSESHDFRTGISLGSPQLEVVIKDSGKYTLEWSVDFMNQDETETYRAFLDEHFKFLGIKAVGVHLNEGLAAVYPKGPKGSSNLVDVTLENLDGSGRLASDSLNVKTGLPTEAQSPLLDFRFAPADKRFDQVQAYFFADQAIQYFKSHFDASPLVQVELKVQVGDHSNTAFYYGNRIRIGTGDGIKYQNLAQDPSVVMHEVGHALVDRYAGLPSDGEGGSLNEAFADYFAASIIDNPNMGESSFLGGPFVRTLENNYQTSELGSGLYKASQVVSGSLWDLRQALGPQVGDQLAFRTLLRLGMGSTFKDFAPGILEAARVLELSPAQTAKANEILRARGWELN